MTERSNVHAWNACVGATLPWVRIPLFPPFLTLGFIKQNMDFDDIKKATKHTSPSKGKYQSPFENIFSKKKNYFDTNFQVPSMMRRCVGFTLDLSTALFIRFTFLILLINFYIKPITLDILKSLGSSVPIKSATGGFSSEFLKIYITELLNRGHLTIIFLCLIGIYLLGHLYYCLVVPFYKSFFPLSRSMTKLVVLDQKTLLPPSKAQSCLKYLSGILPFIITIILCKFLTHSVSPKYLIYSGMLVFFAWYDLPITWLKKSKSISDIIAGTIVLKLK